MLGRAAAIVVYCSSSISFHFYFLKLANFCTQKEMDKIWHPKTRNGSWKVQKQRVIHTLHPQNLFGDLNPQIPTQ